MDKRKRSGRLPQLQRDKRNRLSSANPTRHKTTAARVPLVGGIAVVVAAMQSLLHARCRSLWLDSAGSEANGLSFCGDFGPVSVTPCSIVGSATKRVSHRLHRTR